MNNIYDELTISQVNRTKEKPCVLRRIFFCKLNVRRKSIVTLALT